MLFARIIDNDYLYAVRETIEIITSPYADIAFIRVRAKNNAAVEINMKSCIIDLYPPKVGVEVVGFWFHSLANEQSISLNEDGGPAIVVNNHPKVTTWTVIEVVDHEIASYQTPAFDQFVWILNLYDEWVVDRYLIIKQED